MALNILNSEEIFSRAIAMHTACRYPEAEQLYRQVLQLNPNHPGSHQNLGVLAFQVGRNDAAIPLLKKAIELLPKNAALYCNLGDVYAALRQGDDAIACYQKALTLDPKMPTVYNNLGIVYSRLGRVEDAITAWQKAIELSAQPVQGGRVLVGMGSSKANAMSEEKMLAAAAYNNLGNAYLQKIDLRKAQECHRKACELNPDYPNAHSNYLRDLTHIEGQSPAELLAEHRRWWVAHTKEMKELPHTNVVDPERRLRVGFISPDLREHSVTHFLMGLFEKHDRGQFEFACYSGVNRPDEFTQRLAKCVVIWRNALGMHDENLARAIQEDKIDILFDLSGHTSDTRLRVFAYKPAPVQVTYLGYPMTTGAPCIDYRIVDGLSDPVGMTDSHYSEKLCRLPATAWCYRPPVMIPVEEVPPVIRNKAPFTFGSFNNCSKMSPPTFKLWAKVLHAVPGSRLIVKAAAMADANTREIVMKRFEAEGISKERVLLLQQQLALQEHFAAYGQVDLGLDTFPYHGTTTTCEALWMNVPVLTLTGEMHIARVGTSLLTNAGLKSMVAASEDEFVATAKRLAENPAELQEIRKGLREKFRTSPVMDDANFAKEFGDALRTMWRDWCAKQKR